MFIFAIITEHFLLKMEKIYKNLTFGQQIIKPI